MADIQTKNFTTLVTDQATTIQGGASGLVDLTIGSILRAVVEAYSAVALWLQALVLKVLALTRAATSTGTDLDSWMADFGLVRLGAVAATTAETFSRFTPTAQAVVPIGVIVQTGDGTQQYSVIVDTTNTAYNANLGGYVIAVGVASVTVPVQALVAGSAANVTASSINILAQAIPGVDTVSNAANISNGEDAETDPAFRIRFVEYLSSLSRATKAAVAYAIRSTETGLAYSIVENETYGGLTQFGYFYAVVDDGSGAPSDGLIGRVYAAIDAVRPLTSSFGVFPPVVEVANAVLQIKVASTYGGDAIADVVQSAITNYIDSLTMGTPLPWSRLIQLAYDASPGVTAVPSLTLNGGTADLLATAKQVIKAGTITVAAVS